MDPIELLAGTHVELVNAKFTGGVRLRGDKLILSGVEVSFADYHGDMNDLERLGSSDFKATVVIEGRIVREAVPDKVPPGQQTLPLADDDPPPAATDNAT